MIWLVIGDGVFLVTAAVLAKHGFPMTALFIAGGVAFNWFGRWIHGVESKEAS